MKEIKNAIDSNDRTNKNLKNTVMKAIKNTFEL